MQSEETTVSSSEKETIEEIVTEESSAVSVSPESSSTTTLDGSGFEDEVKKMDYTQNRDTLDLSSEKTEQTESKEEKQSFFKRTFSAKPLSTSQEEQKEEKLPPKMVTIKPSMNDYEDSEPIVNSSLTTSSFVLNNLKEGLPELLHILSKGEKTTLKKYPQQYHSDLKKILDRIHEKNKDVFQIPEWHLKNLEEPLATFFTEKGIEQKLPSWLPIGVGITFITLWAFSTVKKVQKSNQEAILTIITEMEEKKLNETLSSKLQSKLSDFEVKEKQLMERMAKVEEMEKKLEEMQKQRN